MSGRPADAGAPEAHLHPAFRGLKTPGKKRASCGRESAGGAFAFCPKDNRRNATETGNLFLGLKSAVETGNLFLGLKSAVETNQFTR